MAVINGIAGLEVSVEIDGERATEYDAPEDGSMPSDLTRDSFFLPDEGPARWNRNGLPVVVKYIAAIPGAPFQIRLKKTGRFQPHAHHIAFHVELDGHIHTSTRHEPGQYEAERSIGHWDFVRKDWTAYDAKEGWQALSLRFGTLDVDSEANFSHDEIASQMALSKQLGVIRVYIHHQLQSHAIDRPANGRPNDYSAIGKLGEKALKGRALDCKVTIHAKPANAPIAHHSYHADRMGRPSAIFEFRYRSLDGLIKEGIVSRASEQPRIFEPENQQPQPKAPAKPEDDRAVKRERDESVSMNAAEFRAKYKTRRLETGRFEIDLTDD